MAEPIKLGALLWNQYTDWPALRQAAVTADRLGYDDLWTWDHMYPIVGSPDGPMFEGWLSLTAWAEATQHANIGLMVGANTFRNPALVAKMATTLDHISKGRAILGIGGAWFETEHRAFEKLCEGNGGARPWQDQPVGTPEQIAEILRPYLGIGFRHFVVGFPHPYDTETMERLIRDVGPMLEA